jgi:chloramphenicol O-acetyltransferase type B
VYGEFKRMVKNALLRSRHAHLSLGRGSRLSRVSLGRHVRVGASAELSDASCGDYSYFGPRCIIACADVGRFCSVAAEVHIGSGSHPTHTFVSTHPATYLARPTIGWSLATSDHFQQFARTTIGNDVWIGAKAIIRDGVTIGDGAIIGAGAVVVRDVEPYAIHGGVPARLIRKRFADADIALLLRTRWWDMGEDWLRANLHLLHDIQSFRDAFAGDVSH